MIRIIIIHQDRNIIKQLGIVQPGKIGDIIICLPIAKYYHDRGYEIIWPIVHTFLFTFVNVIDYVKFIPIPDTPDSAIAAKQILDSWDCDKIIELAFGFGGYEKLEQKFYSQNLTFDEYKYEIADVPFDEKWNLKIKRNKEIEQQLFDSVTQQEKYIIQHFDASTNYRAIKLTPEIYDNHQIININKKFDIMNGVFDWIEVLERATYLVLINSVFANLVNQLDINAGNRMYLHRLDYPEQINPVLRGKWKQI